MNYLNDTKTLQDLREQLKQDIINDDIEKKKKYDNLCRFIDKKISDRMKELRVDIFKYIKDLNEQELNGITDELVDIHCKKLSDIKDYSVLNFTGAIFAFIAIVLGGFFLLEAIADWIS